MKLAKLSIERPIFITCVVLLMLVIGRISINRMPVDLFPRITFPVVMVSTTYMGAGPKEIETSVSKPLEEEISSLQGLKSLKSINREGVSTVVAEFTLETDVKFAEQQIRDRVSSAKKKLPDDIEEPVIRRIDPSDQPVVFLALGVAEGETLSPGELYTVADEIVRPKLEQVAQVGRVEIIGGRKREIHVELDRQKLKSHEVSATQVASRLGAAGQDVPLGKVEEGAKETVLRALGEFKTLKDVENLVVSFFGNDVPVTIGDVGTVHDTLRDERSRSYVNGKQAISIAVFRQSEANTVRVAETVRKQTAKINELIGTRKGKPQLTVVRDSSKYISANILDVKESIFLGIFLTVIVVFLFLGSGKSTIITGLALPNSLLGAFILMGAMGFTINMMTLLALSLSVGLLIDDAIVVRENIFRHNEAGMEPRKAALFGASEVALAVIATTLTVIAVFGPIAFLQGVVGQFFKEFGLTICFIMAISLFDAFTMAPMLSAYFAGSMHNKEKKGGRLWDKTLGRVTGAFARFQDRLEEIYERVIKFTIRRPGLIILTAIGVFVVSLVLTRFVPKTFLPPQDYGEFVIGLEMPPGTNLAKMSEVSLEADRILRANKEVRTSLITVGGQNAEANITNIFVDLVDAKNRKGVNTSQFKARLREQLKAIAYANPVVKDFDAVGGGMRPFTVNIVGEDLDQIEKVATQLFDRLKKNPALLDPEFSHKPGKPEFQVVLDQRRAEQLGVSPKVMGLELRTQVEGTTPAIYREGGFDFDIRVRLKPDQRDLTADFNQTFVPNMNGSLVRLGDVGKPVSTTGPASINRQDRGRYIQIAGDIAPGSAGMGGLIADVRQAMDKDLQVPPGIRYTFVGQAENFQELVASMLMAVGLAILFIYFVLSSLYESFVIPLTIMLVLPLAIAGALIALFVTQTSLDLFSMIGCVMLMGIATKNSILLVDYANQLVAQGVDRNTAILRAGRARLRPILMTTVALIAGMLPVAIGLNEASKQRTSMGISIIGGLISSTLLSLVVVPATYEFIDRFRVWSRDKLAALFIGKNRAKDNGHQTADADNRAEV